VVSDVCNGIGMLVIVVSLLLGVRFVSVFHLLPVCGYGLGEANGFGRDNAHSPQSMWIEERLCWFIGC